jgi:hypothetical protein
MGSPWTSPVTEIGHLHPLLNAHNREVHFYANGATAAISPDELAEPATAPGVTELTIVCRALPTWPIELRPAPYSTFSGAPPPAITLRDVLEALHRVLHAQISHVEWARLRNSEEAAVGRAYHRRVRTAHTTAGPVAGAEVAAQGVKRVDFLLDRFMFRGLAPVRGGGGVPTMELTTSG